MTLKLVVTTNVDGDVFELILTKSKYRVGRRHDNDLRIKETYVSAYHSELNRTTEGDYELNDCGSSNGTYLNGVKLQKPEKIKAGDFIKFGILKVAVKEHEDKGPTILSLKDRPVFAKKRSENTSSIPPNGNTGRIGSADSAATGPSPVQAGSAKTSSPELDELEDVLASETALNEALEAKLAEQEKQIQELKDDLARAEDAAETGKEATSKTEELEKQRKKQDQEVEKLRAELDTNSANLENAKAQASKIELELDREKNTARDLHKKVSVLEAAQTQDQKSAGAAQAQLEEALTAKTAELTEISDRVAELEKSKNTLAKVEKEKAALESELATQKKDRAEKEQTLQQQVEGLTLAQSEQTKALEEKLDQVCSELAEEKKNASSVAKELTKVSAVAGTAALLKSQLGESSDRSKELETEKDNLATQLQKEVDEKSNLASRLKDVEKQTQSLEEENQSLQEQVAEKESQVLQQSQGGTQLQKSLAAAEKETSKLKSQLENKSAEAEKAKSELTELKQEVKALRSSAKNSESEKSKATIELQKLEDQMASLSEEKESLARQLDEQANEKEALAEELGKARKAAALERDEAVTAVEQKLAEAESKLEKKEQESQSIEEKLSATLPLIASLEATKLDLEAEMTAFREAGGEATREAASAKEEVMELKAEIAKAKSQTRQQAEQLQAAKAEANQLRIDLKKSRDEASQHYGETEKNLTSKIAELETALSSEKVLHRDLRSKESGLKEELESAKTSLKEIEEQKTRLQTRLEETSKNSGELQAKLNRETAEVAQLRDELESSKKSILELRSDLAARDQRIEEKEAELAEQEKNFSRNESEAVLQLKRDLQEARKAKETSEEKEARLLKEKISVSSSFERLKDQLHALETEKSDWTEREKSLLHDKGVIARKLEKAEASNSELAAKIREEQTNAISHRTLVSKLEAQLSENESESVRREQERIAAVETELRKEKKAHENDLQKLENTEKKLALLQQQKSEADERIQSLQEEQLRIESERASASKILQETEKERATLASALEDKTQLASTHENTIAEKVAAIAALTDRFTRSEEQMVAQHQEEREKLHNEVHRERTAKEELAVELENTRVGMSEAIRKSRDQAEAEQAKLLAEGNSQLSEVEAELSRVIHAREEVETARDALEDELNDREERIEKMSEEIEDLQLKIKDETEQRSLVLNDLLKTKEGLSGALHLNRQSLEKAEERLLDERETTKNLQSELKEAGENITRLDKELKELRETHEMEIQKWESRYDELREEKLTLASEDANLKRIREQIREAQEERRTIETNLKKLRAGHESSSEQFESLEEQKQALLKDREQLKAELNAARNELETAQKRQLQSEQRREKLAETITSSEKRIASLQKLEFEIENVVERKRKQGIVSRSEIFKVASSELESANGEFSREDFYRKLINKLDLIDDLSKRYDSRWRYPRVAEQLALLKSSFLDFLHDHSVKEFNLEPGTVLSVEERKRIKLVPQRDSVSKKSASLPPRTNGQRSKVISTIRPGYVYRDGSRDVIIRKAEVVVA